MLIIQIFEAIQEGADLRLFKIRIADKAFRQILICLVLMGSYLPI